MTRVVFLDFDGVLLPYPVKRENPQSAEAVEALNRITDKTGAKIVISSTWRLHGLDACRAKLTQWRVTGEVIGATTDSAEFNGTLYISRPRTREISEWLDEHPDTSSFVILDDETLPEAPGATRPWLRPFHVKTDHRVGLQRAHADAAIELFARLERRYYANAAEEQPA